MGGQLALFAATLNPSVGATVNFYGIHPNVKPDYSKLSGPVLGLFAEKDGFVTPQVAKETDAAIKKAGRQSEIHIYPNVDHGFFNDERPDVYNKASAEDAWRRTLAFFAGRRERSAAHALHGVPLRAPEPPASRSHAARRHGSGARQGHRHRSWRRGAGGERHRVEQAPRGAHHRRARRHRHRSRQAANERLSPVRRGRPTRGAPRAGRRRARYAVT